MTQTLSEPSKIFKKSQHWSIHMKNVSKQTFKNSQVDLQRVLQMGKVACACSIPKTGTQLLKLNTAKLKVWDQDITNKVPGVGQISPLILLGTSDTPPITPTLAIVEAHNFFCKDTMLIFNAKGLTEFSDIEDLVKAVQVFEDEKNAEFFLTLSEVIRWHWVRSKIALHSK
ncbi:hypothetical protein CROQUDRAFT_661705 [Cronartium quercuum f. sp. fusiforme G11]|uniref:Uncharacterized protein n=1 Tax=Cronartium quercuum f. sp. fusiforme G11 TaxID=708437 RepID=A0A9P6T8Y9_9BASI|nr:hypothetical protein CROQUDRAFT_661705 [Cronartium quercuum f. sp. fusiforme G11]